MVRYISIFVMLLLFSCAELEKKIEDKNTSTPLVTLPLLHIQPALYDLGDVKEGDEAVATFLVRNNSQQMIELVDIQASCGCTAAEPDSYIILPESFTQLKVTVDTTSKQQDIKKTIHITDSLGNKSLATLVFNVVENHHRKKTAKIRGIFDGQCASCHFTPLRGVKEGMDIYAKGCAMCHGTDAAGAYAPNLRGYSSLTALKDTISHGVGKVQMPGFAEAEGGPLTPRQIHDLAKWLMTLSGENDGDYE